MARLTDPLTLPCGLEISNRLAKAAMTEDLADVRNGAPNERHERLYRRWSEGGVGLVITGNVMVDRRYLERSGNVVVDEQTPLPALDRFARAAKTAGNAALVQVSHPGRQTSRFITRQPVAPSRVRVRVLGSFAAPRALADAEIEAIIDRFADVAATVTAAGFDGVQIHAAHGYLASQFLSPLTNQRTDRWGGPLRDRARFLLEVVRRTRARLGARQALAVKLNSADFQRGGFSEEESLQVGRWLADEGIDLLEVSGGNYESPRLLGVEDERSERTRAREAYFLTFAERLRAAVSVPLMLTGGVRTRETMQAVLADGSVDLVGLARPLALEPGLPQRLLDGRAERSAATEQRVGVSALDAMAEAGWYGRQLIRMGDGDDPDPSLCPIGAAVTYLGRELRAAAVRPRS